MVDPQLLEDLATFITEKEVACQSLELKLLEYSKREPELLSQLQKERTARAQLQSTLQAREREVSAFHCARSTLYRLLNCE